MKKIFYLFSGLSLLLIFESCTKEKLQPNNYKNASTYQQQSSEYNPTPNLGPPTCPHAPCSNTTGSNDSVK